MHLPVLTMNSTSVTISEITQADKDTFFDGFSNIEIFDDSMWIIKPKTYSTTIEINPDIFDQLIYELTARYGTPEDKGRYGLIYRCMLPEHTLQHVTVTCYGSTNVVSIQGSLHRTWVNAVLADIGKKITDEDKSFVSSQSSHPCPVTSTPSERQSSSSYDSNDSLPNFDLNTDLSESSVQISESSVQAGTKICNVKTQTDVMPNETCKLKAKLQSAQDKMKDLNRQLTEYKELRNNFTQLSSAYSELSERNSVLEAELRSMKEETSHSENFLYPKVTNRAHKSLSNSHIGINTHNSFSVLNDQADSVPSVPSEALIVTPERTEQTSPSIPSAPSISLMTPERTASTVPSAPSISLMTPERTEHTSPSVPSAPSISLMTPAHSLGTITVPNVATSNRFQALSVEDCTADLTAPSESNEAHALTATHVKQESTNQHPTIPPLEPEDLPPIPLPWKIENSSSAKPTQKSKKSKHVRASKPTTSTPETTSESVISTPPSTAKRLPHEKPTVLIIGDSIPKGIVAQRLSRKYRVINRCIPGTKLQLWTKIVPSMIEEEKPTCIIIHCGTNNIQNCLTNECLSLYQELIASIRSVSPVHIAVSSLTIQKHSGRQIWINEFNMRLRELCDFYSMSYICNDNITVKEIAKEDKYKLHLSRRGTSLLAQNYIEFLRGFSIQNLDFYIHKDFLRKR